MYLKPNASKRSPGVKNLFNRSFNYQDMDPLNPTLKPDRMAYVRVTLSF